MASRNKLEGRYAGKHNGRHYRGVEYKNINAASCEDFSYLWNAPGNLIAHHFACLERRKYSRKQRKAFY